MKTEFREGGMLFERKKGDDPAFDGENVLGNDRHRYGWLVTHIKSGNTIAFAPRDVNVTEMAARLLAGKWGKLQDKRDDN